MSPVKIKLPNNPTAGDIERVVNNALLELDRRLEPLYNGQQMTGLYSEGVAHFDRGVLVGYYGGVQQATSESAGGGVWVYREEAMRVVLTLQSDAGGNMYCDVTLPGTVMTDLLAPVNPSGVWTGLDSGVTPAIYMFWSTGWARLASVGLVTAVPSVTEIWGTVGPVSVDTTVTFVYFRLVLA